MRRMTYFVMALAMMLGFTQCKKDQIESQDQGGKVNITLNVNKGGNNNNGSRVNVTGPDVNFVQGDRILVAYDGKYVGHIDHNGTCFTGTIDATGDNTKPLYFYFLGNKADVSSLTEGSSTTCTVNISDQANYPHLPVISMAPSNETFDGSGTYTAHLLNKCSLMEFDVTSTSTAAICITGMNNQVTVNFDPTTVGTDEGFSYSKDTEVGFMKLSGKDGDGKTYAIVLPQTELTTTGEAYTIDGYEGTRPALPALGTDEYYTSYTITMSNTQSAWDGDLSKLTNSSKEAFATARNGMRIYNSIAAGVKTKVSIADGATVTLDNATITYTVNDADHAGLTCEGDATIMLADGTTNTIVGGLDGDGYSNWPGIFVPAGSTLTINGNTGVLNARRGGDDTDHGSPAGIGASWKNPCGNIVINGGVIDAVGGAKSAGIGGTFIRACGDITINGGTITATGHKWGVGIGLGGTENASATSLSGGNITITGGTVIATGGDRGAGIGTGSAEHKSGATMTITLGNILISGGNVTANGGQYGAGIGIGNSEVDNINKCGTITIEGGTVTATGGEKAAGIGCGRKNQGNNNSECGAITISGGTVSATGGAQAAGIGCGYHDVNGNTGDLKCGDITITSGVTSVTATKGSDAHNCIGVNKTTNRTTCTRVTIGGTLYWGPAGATYYYANGGDTYLTESPCVYPKP